MYSSIHSIVETSFSSFRRKQDGFLKPLILLKFLLNGGAEIPKIYILRNKFIKSSLFESPQSSGIAAWRLLYFKRLYIAIVIQMHVWLMEEKTPTPNAIDLNVC